MLSDRLIALVQAKSQQANPGGKEASTPRALLVELKEVGHSGLSGNSVDYGDYYKLSLDITLPSTPEEDKFDLTVEFSSYRQATSMSSAWFRLSRRFSLLR